MLTLSKTLAVALALALPAAGHAATIQATAATVFAGKGVKGDRGLAANALGAEDGTFLSLGLGGAAVFSFGQLFTGPAAILEVTWNTRVGFLESARVYVGNIFDTRAGAFRPDDFTDLGTITNQSASNVLSFNGAYRYLAIVDTSPRRGKRDGFDIDSVSVTSLPASASMTPVPLPASGLLLGAGLLALYASRRVRRT